MVNREPFGTGRERDTSLATQAEPFLLQIPPQNTQKGDNTKDAQKDQKTNPFCCLNIWKSPQETMEDQKQKTQEDKLGNPQRLYPMT